jgi:hypothetical protein
MARSPDCLPDPRECGWAAYELEGGIGAGGALPREVDASAQRRQTHAWPFCSSGTLSSTSGGMTFEKHQQVLLPAAMPHALSSPQIGHRTGSLIQTSQL